MKRNKRKAVGNHKPQGSPHGSWRNQCLCQQTSFTRSHLSNQSVVDLPPFKGLGAILAPGEFLCLHDSWFCRSLLNTSTSFCLDHKFDNKFDKWVMRTEPSTSKSSCFTNCVNCTFARPQDNFHTSFIGPLDMKRCFLVQSTGLG